MLQLANLTRKEGLHIIEQRSGQHFLSLNPIHEDGVILGIIKRLVFGKDYYYKKIAKLTPLYGKNHKLFTKTFGKQLFCYTTWYRGHYWFFEHKGYIISACTSIRGTDYRIYSNDYLTYNECKKLSKSFVKELLDTIDTTVD